MKKNHSHACLRRSATNAFENLYDWLNTESDASLRKFIEEKTFTDIIAEGKTYLEDNTMICECPFENGLLEGEVVQHTYTYEVVFTADSKNPMYSVESFVTGDMEWIEEIDGEYKIESYQDLSFSSLKAAVDYAVLAFKATQDR